LIPVIAAAHVGQLAQLLRPLRSRRRHAAGHGRTVARLEIDGRDINRQMVADGLAWH